VAVHPGLALVVRSFAGVVPAGTVVVTPERQIAYMAVFYARVRARTRPPLATSDAHTFRLLPEPDIRPGLAALLDDPAALPGDVPPPRELHYLRHGLVLVREDAFQRLLERLPEDDRAFYLSWRTR
jgi:hypothetical protein